MSIRNLLLPFTLPLGLLILGSWRLAANPAPARPDYARPPLGGATCSTNPSLADDLLREGHRLGIAVVRGEPELQGRDASYRAEPGRLGTITLKPRPMAAKVRCMLISHEFIHVLQHLYGNLKGVPPLGWGAREDLLVRTGSAQEAEAYTHQNHAGYVLQLLKATKRPR